jgi:hypothetical protein
MHGGNGVMLAGALASIALCGLAASAQAAAGLEPGVHRDPGSPAAKEYALPINQARQTGSPNHTASGSAALFGAGIKPPGSGGSPHQGSSLHRIHAGDRSVASGAARAGSPSPTALPAAVLRSASGKASSGGDDSILVLLAGGVAILVLGGFGGVVMRRGHPRTPSV